jgi:hypothetical protein
LNAAEAIALAAARGVNLVAAVRRMKRCDWPGNTVIVEPGEAVPPDAAVCPRCGRPHVLVVREEVVQVDDDGRPRPLPAGASGIPKEAT